MPLVGLPVETAQSGVCFSHLASVRRRLLREPLQVSSGVSPAAPRYCSRACSCKLLEPSSQLHDESDRGCSRDASSWSPRSIPRTSCSKLIDGLTTTGFISVRFCSADRDPPRRRCGTSPCRSQGKPRRTTEHLLVEDAAVDAADEYEVDDCGTSMPVVSRSTVTAIFGMASLRKGRISVPSRCRRCR